MTPSRPSPRRRAGGLRYRRCLAAGMLASVLLHGLLALAWRAGPGPGLAGAADPAARSAAPAERDAVQAVRLADRRRDAVAVPPPPVPVAEISPDVSSPRVRGDVELAAGELTPHAAGAGGQPGSDGAGAGGAAGGGSRRPPVPRSVLPEWDPPESVRGMEVTVRVHVDSAGRPTGAVELRPPTPSGDFNRRLRQKVRAMEFSPARFGGRPVAGWARLTFVF